MNPDQIKAAVDAALESKVVLSYAQLFIYTVVVGIAAFFGAYLKEKAKNYASKEDIRELTGKVESIKSAYAKDLEDYKQELSRRAQAARIAEVLARSFYGDGTNKVEYLKLVWELSIWLPADLVRKLSVCLVTANKDTADPKQILIEVRKLLYGGKDDLTADQIIHIKK